MTLLAYCADVLAGRVPYLTDASDLRAGRLTPGSHLRVYHESERPLASSGHDRALLLAWTYLDEVLHKERDWIESGGRFVVPFPEPRLVP
jgi:hypothetical protein